MSAEAFIGPARRHRWNFPICVFGDRTPTGCEQSERECQFCGLIRITVHPPQGFPWREWRKAGSDKQFPSDHTPPCNPPGEVSSL